jgi:hypothetical protein
MKFYLRTCDVADDSLGAIVTIDKLLFKTISAQRDMFIEAKMKCHWLTEHVYYAEGDISWYEHHKICDEVWEARLINGRPFIARATDIDAIRVSDDFNPTTKPRWNVEAGRIHIEANEMWFSAIVDEKRVETANLEYGWFWDTFDEPYEYWKGRRAPERTPCSMP